MPRITKGNVKEYLSDASAKFHQVFGESIGVVHSWEVIWSESFRRHVSDSRETVWRWLIPEHAINEGHGNMTNPDDEMNYLLKQDLKSHTVQTLRKILSWATHKSIGKG